MKAERAGGGVEPGRGARAFRAPGGLAATLLAALASLAATFVSADAWPKTQPKAQPKGASPVAGVEVRAAGLGPSVSEPLRRSVEGEARRLAWKDVPGSERFVLATSLLRLDTTRRPGGARVNAVVAVSVFGVDRGDVKAVVEGSAEIKGDGARSRRAAVEAAARGAVRSLPTALRMAHAEAKAQAHEARRPPRLFPPAPAPGHLAREQPEARPRGPVLVRGRPGHHPRLFNALHAWITRHPDDGRYILTNGYDWTYFTVDDVPFFVQSVREAGDGLELELHGGVTHPFSGEGLSVGADEGLYVPVTLNGGDFEAKFTRYAQAQLAPFLVEESEGRVGVRIGGRVVVPTPRAASSSAASAAAGEALGLSSAPRFVRGAAPDAPLASALDLGAGRRRA
ncbi:MAG: hypothetical protein MUF34_01375 [Polyangiaceae bacterium]|nr:hypothetical protein [Polyangiaceae bacterium]